MQATALCSDTSPLQRKLRAHYAAAGNPAHVSMQLRTVFSLRRPLSQVPPAELEDLLRTHPAVSDVAVAGIPHDRLGEAPRAYVVRREGNDNVDEEQVRGGGRKQTARLDFLTYERNKFMRKKCDIYVVF